ncbi:enoyl-CoA hydratase/isomerase family protein [Phaeobacter porticola]|uniref:Enoyl-CoA hydratase/isomerase family protein n=1 Tax=Phaeobacter porticola TaxID=1844006 RepID=A0A1L3I4C7_9RHOB|nr:enoyl-CoA hydratase/isomerase family protein [Phaeobacter porticola]APG46995.1 enoyl-CoA hydratase/isomerase family protein [Phaeobacter porticola]
MTDSEWLLRKSHGDGILEIQLARAPVNALSPAFLMDFASTIKELGEDPDIRAVLLTSAFKVFSAGLDLKAAREFDLSGQQAAVQGLNEAFLALYAFPKPVVAAVNGAAIAGGLFFVLCSDVRVAQVKSKFGLAEVQAGVDFPVAPLEIARATLNPNIQRRLMLTGQNIGPIAARNFNIVDIIADDAEDLLGYSLKEARTLAALPPKAYAAIKHQLRGETIARIRAAMTSETVPKAWFTDETIPAMTKAIG